MPKKVTMGKGEFVREHEHLVKTLRTGSKAAQKREASEQAAELKAKR